MQATIARQMCCSATCFACTRGGERQSCFVIAVGTAKLAGMHATCTCHLLMST